MMIILYNQMNKILRNSLSIGQYRKIGSGTLISRLSYCFSDDNFVLLDKGSLEVRNSDSLELKLFKLDVSSNKVTPFSLSIGSDATLKELKQTFLRQVPVTNLRVHSQRGEKYSQKTAVQALLDRFFTLTSDQYKIKIEGQYMNVDLDEGKSWEKELRLSIEQVQQPLLIQREIESYINRVQTWLDAKNGIGNENIRLKSKQVQDILVQALVDPECRWSTLSYIELQWREEYHKMQNLKKKYEQAVSLSQKMAKRRMYLDMVLLASNVAFVGCGTYIVYSWDIIEPWAYFISSLASIYLFRKAAKFRKPFSLSNYKNYLIYEIYLQKAAAEVNLDLKQMKEKELQLQLMETALKDYLIKLI